MVPSGGTSLFSYCATNFVQTVVIATHLRSYLHFCTTYPPYLAYFSLMNDIRLFPIFSSPAESKLRYCFFFALLHVYSVDTQKQSICASTCIYTVSLERTLSCVLNVFHKFLTGFRLELICVIVIHDARRRSNSQSVMVVNVQEEQGV